MALLEELQALIRRHAIANGDRKQGMFAVMAEAPTEMQHHVVEPVFVVVAQGAKRAMLGDEVFEYRGGQFLVVGVELPLAGGVIEASPELPYLSAGMGPLRQRCDAVLGAVLVVVQLGGEVDAPIWVVPLNHVQPFGYARLTGIDLLTSADKANHRSPI